MNFKKICLIVLAILIVVGIGVFAIMGKNNNEKVMQNIKLLQVILQVMIF